MADRRRLCFRPLFAKLVPFFSFRLPTSRGCANPVKNGSKKETRGRGGRGTDNEGKEKGKREVKVCPVLSLSHFLRNPPFISSSFLRFYTQLPGLALVDDLERE